MITRRSCCAAGLLLLLILPVGCNVLGVAAQALPPARVEPQYHGLAGETVAVMVWVDRGIRIDWPSMQLDLTSAIQTSLESAATVKKTPKQLAATTFPLRPASVVRFQKDNPGLELQPIAEVAPRLGVTRLIYVEVEDFSTRSAMAMTMYRGSCVGTLRIIEITDNQAKVVYEENNIQAIFPPKSREEGVINSNDYAIYLGTLKAFTQEIVDRLVPYEERS